MIDETDSALFHVFTGSVAFHAAFDTIPTIRQGSVAEFDVVLLNIGNG